MKTRSNRPSSISTEADAKARTHASIDNDFAPSVTPSSAGSDFPRVYSYHAPKDKTWWPKQNPMVSPEPADPTPPKPPRKTSDPTYKPRGRDTRNLSSTSSAVSLKAATAALRMQTRAGVKKPTNSAKPKTESSHVSNGTSGTKGNHCVPKKTSNALTTTRPAFRRPNYDPKHSHVRFNTKPGAMGSNVMTLDQLPRSPRSPKNSTPYRIQGRHGNKEIDFTATPLAVGSASSGQRRPSAADSVKRIEAAEKRSSFERRNGLGNRLGSFDSFGMRTPSITRATFGSNGKRKLSETGEEAESRGSANKRRRSKGAEFSTEEIDQIYVVLADQAQIIRQHPEHLTLEHIGPLFNYVTGSIQSFSEEHFSFELTLEQREAWPLHQLSSRYLPLMLITQYIADGSQHGWRHFFTTPASRSALVSGVIGEWVRQRVFNHTCFGMSAENIEKLEDMDRKYLHHDAFLRSKKRAAMVQEMLRKDPRGCRKDLFEAVDELSDELMAVLMPLMPESIFAYSRSGRYFNEDTSSTIAVDAKEEIRAELAGIIAGAARLHRGMRVMGKDGTIIRIAQPVQKGEQYYESAPFEIVNEKMVKETKHHGLKAGAKKHEDGKLKIKMTCFPRVEAYVPHGPDYEQMAEQELKERQLLVDGKELDWDQVEGFWPDLPQEIVREQERDHGKENVRKTGSYVTIYPRLTCHQVYCEWMPPRPEKKVAFKDSEAVQVENSEDENNDYQPTRRLNAAEQHANRTYGEPLPKIQHISLKEAVKRARNDAGWFKHTFEDGLRTTWNGFCRWEGPAELALTVGSLSWYIYHWYCNRSPPGYQSVKELGLHTTQGWRQLDAAARAKVLEVSEKGRRSAYKVLGKVQNAGKQGQRVTVNIVEEVKKAKPAGVARESVHGVLPKSK